MTKVSKTRRTGIFGVCCGIFVVFWWYWSGIVRCGSFVVLECDWSGIVFFSVVRCGILVYFMICCGIGVVGVGVASERF